MVLYGNQMAKWMMLKHQYTDYIYIYAMYMYMHVFIMFTIMYVA